jgi:hypothetical protein
MTADERRELLAMVMAAMQAVVPRVTSDEQTLVREVLDGMLREFPPVLGYD